jgi:hypothetical protein
VSKKCRKLLIKLYEFVVNRYVCSTFLIAEVLKKPGTYEVVDHSGPRRLGERSSLEPHAQPLLRVIDVAVDVDPVCVEPKKA